MHLDLQTIPDSLADFCRVRHIRRLSIFGSALRDELRPDSDVDLLIEFDPEMTPSYFELVALSDELSPFFGGRRIDLVTPKALHRIIRDSVTSAAKVLYEG
jgi:predicted nucleotidyltransferase